MKVVRARDMGMCFGVRDALQATKRVEDPSLVTIHGELVHNPVVNQQLVQLGFQQSSEAKRSRLPTTPQVMITAHGISDRERRRLLDGNKRLLDTTCPLVQRVHDAAKELASEKRLVLLIGKAGHVEVRGIMEDLDRCEVVSEVAQVQHYENPLLGVLCQTTMPAEAVSKIYQEICRQNAQSDIRFIDTVCQPTKRRQAAVLELIRRVEAVVVVGGFNSNNSRRLMQLCQSHDVPVVLVEHAEQLDEEWLRRFSTVGLTAGTSTLDKTIDEVERWLKRI